MSEPGSMRATSTAVILVFICLLGAILACVGIRMFYFVSGLEIERAARRVGAEPTLEGIGEYIVKSIRPGMSREQVEQALSKLGSLEIDRGVDLAMPEGSQACEVIWLRLGRVAGTTWEMSACYDASEKLVQLISADPETFPALNIWAP